MTIDNVILGSVVVLALVGACRVVVFAVDAWHRMSSWRRERQRLLRLRGSRVWRYR